MPVVSNRPNGWVIPTAPRLGWAMQGKTSVSYAEIEATRAMGVTPILNRASTDSNIPISLGIPAITIGAGGVSGDSHRLSEWYDPIGREIGYKRALLLAVGMTGLA